ncbi:hypothetical protein BH23CHL8_BH23CHL8_29530 [soil metagenome]
MTREARVVDAHFMLTVLHWLVCDGCGQGLGELGKSWRTGQPRAALIADLVPLVGARDGLVRYGRPERARAGKGIRQVERNSAGMHYTGPLPVWVYCPACGLGQRVDSRRANIPVESNPG